MSSQLSGAAAQKSASYNSSGRKNAVARYNQMMPGDWTHLGPGDLMRIKLAVQRRLEPRASLHALEACFMVQALLTTGRQFRQLHRLRAIKLPHKAALAHLDPGLILRDGRRGWWLPAGRPRDRGRSRQDQMKPLSEKLWLPISRNAEAILHRCLRKREVGGHQTDYPLFVTPATELRLEVEVIISEAMGLSRSRRSARTIQSVERWLFRALTHASAGDPAAAALITGRYHSVASSMIHYGSLSIEQLIALHRETVRQLDEYAHEQYPPELGRFYIGDARTPADGAVRKLSCRLAEELAKAGSNLGEVHSAMTAYTLALIAFALGLRGGGRVPGYRGIDAETGFAFVHDKHFDRIDMIRMVWVCDVAQQQLREYERHLDALGDVVSIAERGQLEDIRASAHDAFPYVGLRHGLSIHKRDIADAADVWKHSLWPGERNAGRHWLRGKLSGLCASETLAAFLGHWQSGVQPWGETSALDPLRYRADLRRAFDGVMESVGWKVQASPLAA